MDSLNNVPRLIPAIVKSWDGTWLMTVKCPFCDKLHTHGGGDGDQPGRFGGRVSDCPTGDRGGYEIINPQEVGK